MEKNMENANWVKILLYWDCGFLIFGHAFLGVPGIRVIVCWSLYLYTAI